MGCDWMAFDLSKMENLSSEQVGKISRRKELEFL
jgi:hypothetical protein